MDELSSVHFGSGVSMTVMFLDNLELTKQLDLPTDGQAGQSFIEELWQRNALDFVVQGVPLYFDGYTRQWARRGTFVDSPGSSGKVCMVQAFVPTEGGPFPICYHWDFVGLTYVTFFCNNRFLQSYSVDDFVDLSPHSDAVTETNRIMYAYYPSDAERGKICTFRALVGSTNPDSVGLAHSNGYLEVL